MQRFTLISEALEPGILALRPCGELDLAVADQVADAITAARADRYSVLVDLAECAFIDSTGIAVILRGRLAHHEDGLRLVAARPGGQVKKVLDLVGLDDHGVIFGDRAGALEALRA